MENGMQEKKVEKVLEQEKANKSAKKTGKILYWSRIAATRQAIRKENRKFDKKGGTKWWWNIQVKK